MGQQPQLKQKPAMSLHRHNRRDTQGGRGDAGVGVSRWVLQQGAKGRVSKQGAGSRGEGSVKTASSMPRCQRLRI